MEKKNGYGETFETTPKKLWDHLPIRPSTFADFRKLKSNFKFIGLSSDDAFVKELIRVYKMRLAYLEKKKMEMKQNG